MAILKPDKVTTLGGVTINEFLLTKHNPNKIAMPTESMSGEAIGVTIHNTDWIKVASSTTPAEQYTRATYNGNMGSVRVHYYVDNVCAWQNLPLDLSGWHAADGDGDGNRKTIAIECIMSKAYNDKDKKSEDNAAKLAAALLKKNGWGIDKLYTHTYWLHIRDGAKGGVDELNVKKHSYKTCLPINETELLTPYGWKQLCDITTDDVVAQFHPEDNSITFSDVLDVVEPHESEVISFRGIEATPDHRMLTKPFSSDIYRVEPWGDVVHGNTRTIQTSGYWTKEGLSLNDDEIALLVWIQGDGHYMKSSSDGTITGIEFHLKKERKIQRITQILSNLGIKYVVNRCKNGSVHVRVHGASIYKWAEGWLEDKMFSYKFIKMNQHQFETFLNELLSVDGSNGRQMMYFSAEQQNLDVVQAVCATHGLKTNMTTLGSSKTIYGDKPTTVTISDASYNVGKQNKEDATKRKTTVSCVTVESGFILIRQGYRTFVVGNCPAYILPHWDAFKAKVLSYMDEPELKPVATGQIYRIRKTWADSKSQIGAYRNLQSAMKECPGGYSVFDEKGKAVYKNTEKFMKGQKVYIRSNTPLFASAVTTKASRRISGTYYIYDGVACANGRYRITTEARYCGKAPMGSYVTGYVSLDNFS